MVTGATGDYLHRANLIEQCAGLTAEHAVVNVAGARHGNGIGQSPWLFVNLLEHVVLVVTQPRGFLQRRNLCHAAFHPLARTGHDLQ